MAFDIYQQVFDRDGLLLEKKAGLDCVFLQEEAFRKGLIPYIPAE